MMREHMQSVVFINTYMSKVNDCDEVMRMQYDMVKQVLVQTNSFITTLILENEDGCKEAILDTKIVTVWQEMVQISQSIAHPQTKTEIMYCILDLLSEVCLH